MELVKTDTPVKSGWWASQSKLTKGLVIGIPVLALVSLGVWYFGFRKKDEETKGGDVSKKAVEKGGDDVNSSTESKSETKTETSSTKTESTTKPSTSTPTTTSAQKFDVTKLPNGGKGCTDVRTTYDGNYDYVKCNGVWYTQSKPNPKTASKKIATWMSLGSNKVATTKLNN